MVIGMFCKKSLFWLNALLCFPLLRGELSWGRLSMSKALISLVSSCRALDPVGQMLLQLPALEISNRLPINYYSDLPPLDF